MTPDNTPDPARIAAIRRFSRFYTRRIGMLAEGLLQSGFSLTEARVLYELAQNSSLTGSDICATLDLDAGYLSRIITRFEQQGLLQRTPQPGDRRQSILALTEQGRTAFAPLDEASCRQIAGLLASLPEDAQSDLVAAMRRIEELMDDRPNTPWLLRSHRPGDIGWIVARHGALYAQEYGFDARFEALVAQVAADFLRNHDLAREHCWIAERDGANIGTVMLVRGSDELAKLRLLIVEPAARGLGIGKRLVAECIGFARRAGYSRVALWTNDVLTAARGIYQHAGFRLTTTRPHADFGPAIMGEDWELDLH